MDYTIIIPAYNEEALLSKTLTAIDAIMGKLEKDYSGELIVVDNNSTDRTANIAKEFKAKVVFAKKNCIAVARNAGAKDANGKFLIFIDADTVVSYELLKKALDLMNSNQVCGGGTLIEFDIERMPIMLRFVTWLWHFYIKISPLAAGSFLFCLNEAWGDVGGFDERLYASEEIWFSNALKRWGKKRKLSFKILDIPVLTSARKIDQYSSFQLFSVVFMLSIFPWGVRNKKICHVWYKRDENEEK